MTRRSIEETAAAVMRLLSERRRASGDITMPLWLAPQPLVLASKSDVRGKILAAAGLRFEIRPAQIDERAVEAKAGAPDAAAAARLLARAKAHSVAAAQPGRLVLGADQTLARGIKAFQQAGEPDRGGRAAARIARAHA